MRLRVQTLTEQAAERLLSGQAFAPATPGFVGTAIDLPGQVRTEGSGAGDGTGRYRLRHGFLAPRTAQSLTVSGPPSPGLEVCLARMAEDLPHARSMITEPRATESPATAAGGIRVGLEAGLDTGGPLGLHRRWILAHTLAPVLAAAFANTPSRDGWRSTRQARHRNRPVLPPGSSPRAAWAGYVLDSPIAGSERTAGSERAAAHEPIAGHEPTAAHERTAGHEPTAGHDAAAGYEPRSLREWIRATPGPTRADLDRHAEALRPPVAARGHLELDVADPQPGNGWQVVVAVTAALLDDPRAATIAETATAGLAGEPGLWERAARDALTDPVLAAAARECFLAAYATLARQGVPRDLRDLVAGFTERYVLRGRCPADDHQAHSPVS